jgi:hypothetical protein
MRFTYCQQVKTALRRQSPSPGTSSTAIGHTTVVKTESPSNKELVVLHPLFRRTGLLKWRSRSEILKPLSVSIVLT